MNAPAAIKHLLATIAHRFNCARLRRERHTRAADSQCGRVMSTACWNFPVYSQTFVYQELTQLVRAGYDVRFVYSHLEPRDHLPDQFKVIWHDRRRLVLNDRNSKADFRHYERRFPARVRDLIESLCAASGLSEVQLRAHRHLQQAFSFTRMAEAYAPDYIHSYFFYEGTLFAHVASEILGIPRGVSCYADHVLHDYDLKVVPLHVNRCRLLVATSARIKDELITLAPGEDPSKIVVKPNAINSQRFFAVERTEPDGTSPYKILCVSRLDPKKGLLDLVEAMKILKDNGLRIVCNIVGDTQGSATGAAYLEELRARINGHDLGDTVILDGRGNESHVLARMHEAHVFVAPFVELPGGDKDGIPTTLLEAMSTGLPVVITNAGSMHEVVKDGTDGVIVPQHDAAGLAQAIESLIRDRSLRVHFGAKAAHKIRTSFDVDACEEAFHQKLAELLR